MAALLRPPRDIRDWHFRLLLLRQIGACKLPSTTYKQRSTTRHGKAENKCDRRGAIASLLCRADSIPACPGLRLSSFSAKHSSALHHPLQLLEQRRDLGLGLSRTLAVIRLQTDFRDLFLQILAQNGRRIGRRFRWRPVGLSHFLLV